MLLRRFTRFRSRSLLAFPWLFATLAATPPGLATESTVAPIPSASPPAASAPAAFSPRAVANLVEAQIALARRAFSGGAIDGIPGAQTESALRAFQATEGLRLTGQLDPATRARLVLLAPPFEQIVLSAVDFAACQPVPPTWLGKSRQTALAYETPLESVAEHSHAHPALIRELNPEVDWANVLPGAHLTVPAIGRVTLPAPVARLRIQLGAHVLEATDAPGNILAHFPVSIARRVEKRPAGELHVTVLVPDPDYTFDPELFPDSAEARELDGRLRLPPGPNNPVGVAWIGLDLPGYGIHGTPNPEKIGRTESHGCFRLANWDVLTLLDVAWVGLPVIVEP